MAMKLICSCLLAVALLGWLADAQYYPGTKPQPPQQPKPPQQPYRPPTSPQKPQQAYQLPTSPQKPQQAYQRPTSAQKPQQAYDPLTTQQQSQTSKIPGSQQPSSFHSCDVAEQYKILCGAPAISAQECEAINCCFDGRTCYYGKSVTLQCTKDAQFIVVVARDATLPNLDLETITFLGNEQGCNPVGTSSAFAIYQFPATACGTVIMEEPGVIVYENRMSSSFEVAIASKGAITRDSSYELLCQCRYTGTSVQALVIEVGLVPPPPPVAAPGPLRVELRLGNGQCFGKGCVEEEVAYSSYYLDSDYPITKVLRDPVYVEVRMLERTDPNLVLTLGRCWATSNPSPHSLPQWDLLIDGCPFRDDRYLTSLVPVGGSPDVLYPSHYRRFIFKMFTFVATGAANPSKKGGAEDAGASLIPLKELIYIHCDAAVCQPSLANNCEPRCYRKKRHVAASFLTTTRQDTTMVTSQPIYMADTQ
ncbi:zona pellucida sperm-binding protein 4-like [Solea solea]|uniref:zona pellucida sperm-binding protein 4-like n=1 Tax=Solea solea TaxID=90069 RepID=UPI00272B2782|nr:zona pellucida sperm-binding protein 4-like [Solea solea]